MFLSYMLPEPFVGVGVVRARFNHDHAPIPTTSNNQPLPAPQSSPLYRTLDRAGCSTAFAAGFPPSTPRLQFRCRPTLVEPGTIPKATIAPSLDLSTDHGASRFLEYRLPRRSLSAAGDDP